MAVASFLVQTVSGIREGNEVQVENESDFNVYASDAAMSSSLSFLIRTEMDQVFHAREARDHRQSEHAALGAQYATLEAHHADVHTQLANAQEMVEQLEEHVENIEGQPPPPTWQRPTYRAHH